VSDKFTQVHRFAAYTRYGADYELLQRDLDELKQSLPMWAEFDHAIEILATHVIPSKSWSHECKKAMMIKDLLIKVRNVVCRHQLEQH
jgi:hypothetical protein